MMRSLLRLLGVARPSARWAGVALLSMVVVAAATVFAYNLVRPIYDELLQPGTVVPAAPPGPASGLVSWLDRIASQLRQPFDLSTGDARLGLLLLVLAAMVLKNGGSFLARYAIARIGLATIRDLRNRLADALLGQSPAYFQATTSGVLISRVVSDVQLIREAMSERLGDLVQDSLTVVVLLAYVLCLDLRLALVTLVLAPLLLAPVVHLSRRLRRRSRQSQQQMGVLTSILDETIKGIRVVQAFALEGRMRRRFGNASQQHMLASLRARAIQAANAPLMEIVGTAGFLGLVAYASSRIAAGAMTIGDLSAFVLGIYGTYNPIKRLNKLNLALQQAAVAADRVFEVIDAPVTIREPAAARVLAGVGDGIFFESVRFSYDGSTPVLDGLDLQIPSGSTVALVGASGSGKSTVAQLLPRFWDVSAGAVYIGGCDVRELGLASLRASIGLVTQETVLFSDTVRSNIAFGRDGASEQEIVAAARAANADGFIRQLPHGYGTEIGEAGVRLSGGQRQRLAIARALLKDAPILILDEATSALDREAERLVQAALEVLMQGRTTLLIAHRLCTVQHADTIAVLRDGRIVEQGSHEQLLNARGEYHRLVTSHQP